MSSSLLPSLSSFISPTLQLSLPSFDFETELKSILYFNGLYNFLAFQNEFVYSNYNAHASWKNLVQPAMYVCCKLPWLYLVLDR